MLRQQGYGNTSTARSRASILTDFQVKSVEIVQSLEVINWILYILLSTHYGDSGSEVEGMVESRMAPSSSMTPMTTGDVSVVRNCWY